MQHPGQAAASLSPYGHKRKQLSNEGQFLAQYPGLRERRRHHGREGGLEQEPDVHRQLRQEKAAEQAVEVPAETTNNRGDDTSGDGGGEKYRCGTSET